MEVDRDCVGRLDVGDHDMRASGGGTSDEFGEQHLADSLPLVAIDHVDAVGNGVSVTRLGAPSGVGGVSHDCPLGLGDQNGLTGRSAFSQPPETILERLDFVGPSGCGVHDRVVADLKNLIEVALAGVADHHHAHVRKYGSTSGRQARREGVQIDPKPWLIEIGLEGPGEGSFPEHGTPLSTITRPREVECMAASSYTSNYAC